MNLANLERDYEAYISTFKSSYELEKKQGIKVIDNFTKWKDIKEYLSSLPYTHYYRGQSDARWHLKSRLDRYFEQNIWPTGMKSSDYKEKYEARLLWEFERNTPVINLHGNLLTTIIQKLSYLQHYAAPTSLIDITNSPYVAVFFAIIDCISVKPFGESFCSVYVFDDAEIYKSTYNFVKSTCQIYHSDRDDELMTKFDYEGFNDDELYDLFFRKYYPTKEDNIHDHLSFITHVVPKYYFSRLSQQSGSFLCVGNLRKSFMENYSAMYSKAGKPVISKVIISSKLRDIILIDLEKMNINHSTLFGDMESNVKSMAMRVELNTKSRHIWRVSKFS